MTLAMDAWVRAVDGRLIDRDGRFPAKDPYQCWDLWADYAERVVGVPLAATFTNYGGSSPHPGYACNVFHNAAKVGAISSRFEILGASVTARAGDVAFWERGGHYAGSHVAIVTADLGKQLRCMSQNKGLGHDAAAYEVLSKSTLLGYLRPRTKTDAPAVGQDEKGFLMELTDQEQRELYGWVKGIAHGMFVPGTQDQWFPALNNKLDAIAKVDQETRDALLKPDANGFRPVDVILSHAVGAYAIVAKQAKAQGVVLDASALVAEMRKTLPPAVADELAERLSNG